MTKPLSHFTASSADWRKQLSLNNRKTLFVISLFFLIYFALGMLVDLYICSGNYPQASLSELLVALITFQLFPLATLVMIGVAAISLMITFSFHDKLMLLGTEYREITPESAQNIKEKQLYNAVEEMKIAAGLHYMPRVFVIEADYMNAFASGYSEKSAMIAITQGLLEKLNRSELQAVIAHELSHIRHLDIKLTLMASVLANIIVIVLDVFFYNALYSRRGSDNNNSRNGLAVIIIILRYLLPIINVILLLYLSRSREYMADAGSVELLRDNQPLATALLKIHNDYADNKDNYEQESKHENIRKEAYIFDPTQAGISSMKSISDIFSTHPNIKDRLAAIGFKTKE